MVLARKGAESIAHQTVQNPAGLLGIYQIKSISRGFDIPSFTPVFVISLKVTRSCACSSRPKKYKPDARRLPPPSLSGSVAEEHAVRMSGGFFQLLNQLLFSFDNAVLGLKIIFDVHAEPGFGQVPHMAHRGDNFIPIAQIFLNGFSPWKATPQSPILT